MQIKLLILYLNSESKKKHNPCNITFLQEFATDIAACLDSWVGGIKTVRSKLLIQCSDGSRCIINDIEASFVEDFNEKRDCVSSNFAKCSFLNQKLSHLAIRKTMS